MLLCCCILMHYSKMLGATIPIPLALCCSERGVLKVTPHARDMSEARPSCSTPTMCCRPLKQVLVETPSCQAPLKCLNPLLPPYLRKSGYRIMDPKSKPSPPCTPTMHCCRPFKQVLIKAHSGQPFLKCLSSLLPPHEKGHRIMSQHPFNEWTGPKVYFAHLSIK